MDYKYIEQLLSRYFEATSTLKEEQILKDFFAQDDGDMPAALLPYKSLFASLERHDALDAAFDSRILALTEQAGAHTGGDDTADGALATVSMARRMTLSDRWKPLLRAAAVVAVIISLSTAVNESFRQDNVWTGEEQMARYQAEMQKAAIAEATADSARTAKGYIE